MSVIEGRSTPALEARSRLRAAQGEEEGEDELPVEAPLTIRVMGESAATTMRTPGSDHALAAGFLLAEGFIKSVADLGNLTHCGDADAQAAQHTLEVSPGPGFTFDLDRVAFRRGTLSTSSCGICGREQIDDLLSRITELPHQTTFDASGIRSALDTLATGQRVFARTGSIHGAALFDGDGECLALAEDIGRHNAIDKVVGRLLLDGELHAARLLAISGRISFEVVQKAAMAGVAVVVTSKGVSTLAVDLASEAGITLCAFVRENRLSVYGARTGFRGQVPGTAPIVR